MNENDILKGWENHRKLFLSQIHVVVMSRSIMKR